jgi:tRNA G26 N,N-dimethylase Trm1
MQSGYVKCNVSKHITHKLFYPHELQINGDISILQIKSCNNLTDLFTKSLPYATFYKCVASIGMRRLRDLHELDGALS